MQAAQVEGGHSPLLTLGLPVQPIRLRGCSSKPTALPVLRYSHHLRLLPSLFHLHILSSSEAQLTFRVSLVSQCPLGPSCAPWLAFPEKCVPVLPGAQSGLSGAASPGNLLEIRGPGSRPVRQGPMGVRPAMYFNGTSR